MNKLDNRSAADSASLRIFHISDIHCSFKNRDGDTERVPLDIPSSLIQRVDKLALLKRYLVSINETTPADFVIISGDITDRHNTAGHREFAAWLNDLTNSIDRQKIALVPGNHDVDRYAERAKRLSSFASEFALFRRSYSPDIPELSKPFLEKPELPANLDFSSPDYPFVFDPERNVIIYLFDSTLACGVSEISKVTQEIRAHINALYNNAAAAGQDAQQLHDLEKKYTKSLIRDVPFIGEKQLITFTQWIALLNREVNKNVPPIRIAVLHHHLGQIVSHKSEFEPYDAIIDGGRFKTCLEDNEFQLVLHGHKHLNYVGYEGSKLGASPLAVISCQTICATSTLGYPGFNIISLYKVGRHYEAGVKQIPLTDTYHPEQSAANQPEQSITLSAGVDVSLRDALHVRMLLERVTIKGTYKNLLRSAEEIDILGFGLSRFLQDFKNDLPTQCKKTKVRLLLLDPRFPIDQHSIASIRDVEEKLKQGTIRQQVINWVEYYRDNFTKKTHRRYLPNLEIRLYRFLPVCNILRVNSHIFAGSYLLDLDSDTAPTIVLDRRDQTRPSKAFQGHFEWVWNHETTINLATITPDIVNAWKASN